MGAKKDTTEATLAKIAANTKDKDQEKGAAAVAAQMLKNIEANRAAGNR